LPESILLSFTASGVLLKLPQAVEKKLGNYG